VITVEGWTTIRYLHAQGVGSRTIAKKLGVSRTTVRAAIRDEEPPKRTRAKRPNKKLAPFAERIAEMLFVQGFSGTRIVRELGPLATRAGQRRCTTTWRRSRRSGRGSGRARASRRGRGSRGSSTGHRTGSRSAGQSGGWWCSG